MLKNVYSFLFILFLFTSSTFSLEKIGVVIAVSGAVSALRGENTLPLKRRSPVYKGDALKTSPDSQMKIKFVDNTLLAIGENTTFVIKSYDYKSDGKVKKGNFSSFLQSGAFKLVTGNIPKKNFNVSTPVVVAGVRGTILGQSQVPGEKDTKVGLYKGTISLRGTACQKLFILTTLGGPRFIKINKHSSTSVLSKEPASLAAIKLEASDNQ